MATARMILEIEAPGYADAAGALLTGNRAAAGQHDALVARLEGLGGMAGDDATAADFAAAYDAAAGDALAGLADAAAAFATLGRLTSESLADHRRAETASTLSPGAIVHDTELDLPSTSYLTVLRATPPSSRGGDSPLLTPQQAWVLDHVEGFVWPDADVVRLREAGRAWRGTAAGLDDLAADCDLACAAFETQRSPEIPLAIAATIDLRDTLTGLAVSCAGLGHHCDAHADAVEQKRAEVLALVQEILAIVVEGIVIGVALGAVTAGIGAAGGTAAIAARVAGYSPRFAALLASLRTLTATTAASVRLTHDAIRARRLRLERFLGVPARSEAGAIGPISTGRRVADQHGVRRVLEELAPARNRPHRVVTTRAELEELFESLTRRGREITLRDYAGRAFELPDGTRVAMRSHSASGGWTIDVEGIGPKPWKVHIDG